MEKVIMMDRADWFGTLLVIGLLGICVFGSYMHIQSVNRFEKSCLDRGGVPFMPKHDWICLKKDMVQP